MTTEIRPGMAVTFLHGDERIERGFVNGYPWTGWNGEQVFTSVPVYCTSLSKPMDVAGENIVSVNVLVGAARLCDAVAL